MGVSSYTLKTIPDMPRLIIHQIYFKIEFVIHKLQIRDVLIETLHSVQLIRINVV